MYDTSQLASCGEDVRIDDWVRIKHPDNVRIKTHVAVDAFFYCATSLIIGDYCHISAHVSITGGKTALVTMGNFSHLAAGARLIAYGDGNKGGGLVSPLIPDQYRDELVGGQIIIGDFVSVLTNAIISPGITLGQGSILAANSFANKDIPAWQIWAGSPAKFLKWRRSDKMLDYAQKLGYKYATNNETINIV